MRFEDFAKPAVRLGIGVEQFGVHIHHGGVHFIYEAIGDFVPGGVSRGCFFCQFFPIGIGGTAAAVVQPADTFIFRLFEVELALHKTVQHFGPIDDLRVEPFQYLVVAGIGFLQRISMCFRVNGGKMARKVFQEIIKVHKHICHGLRLVEASAFQVKPNGRVAAVGNFKTDIFNSIIYIGSRHGTTQF